jgi:hypothetical protein
LALLAGLLALLALPAVVRFGLKRLGKGERRPAQVKATRVKLKD